MNVLFYMDALLQIGTNGAAVCILDFVCPYRGSLVPRDFSLYL